MNGSTMKRIGVSAGVSILVAWGAMGTASAYEVVPVTNGGTVTGKVTLDGIPHPPKRFKIEKTPEVCGEEDRLLEEVRVNGNGMLADAVLVLEGVVQGKPYQEFTIEGPPPGTRVMTGESDQAPDTYLRPKECIFGAFTGVVADGKFMRFRNQDPVKHSPHTYGVKGVVRRSMFNQDLEGDGELDVPITFKKKTELVLKLECDQHEHMQNWFRRVDSPYYAFSVVDGSFEITDVPPGEYSLIAWHPKYRRDLKQTVTVEPGGTVEVSFTFKSRLTLEQVAFMATEISNTPKEETEEQAGQ